MLVDDVTIKVIAGKGGDGLSTFSGTMMTLGPTGGDGGRGGDVYIEGVQDLGRLRNYRSVKDFKAAPGRDGQRKCKEGANGDALVLQVPVGTVVHNHTKEVTHEIVAAGERVLVARGGKGGFGNAHFKSSRNTSPQQCTPGRAGEEVELRFELKLIADIGFIGLPNVGKSTLLNELTNASSKVANYQFTTLEPHLGVFHNFILADIPGLIEGAADGKGLGHKFLRHVERTRALVHFVAADSKDPLADYEIVRRELVAYSATLGDKTERVVISRSDEATEERVAEIQAQFKKAGIETTSLSVLDETSIKNVERVLSQLIT